MTERPCTARTQRGDPCRAFAPGDSAYCRVHDPERAAEVRAARSKGGRLRALQGRRRRLEQAGQLARFLSELIQSTLEGKTAPDIARACCYGAAVLRQVIETSELERRLEALEQRIVPGRGPQEGTSWRG